ncbi:MAG TPA: hypothetical protein VF263_19090, partial [Longimicrobiaceae bacterium]
MSRMRRMGVALGCAAGLAAGCDGGPSGPPKPVPGTLTVALGATGIGKTQLGLSFANAGRDQEGQCGLLFDLTTRGDAQNHRDYASRLYGWELTEQSPEEPVDLDAVWD